MTTAAFPGARWIGRLCRLRYQGRKRTHNADEIMAEIVAKRLVEHLERAGILGGLPRTRALGGVANARRGIVWQRCPGTKP